MVGSAAFYKSEDMTPAYLCSAVCAVMADAAACSLIVSAECDDGSRQGVFGVRAPDADARSSVDALPRVTARP